ncbi:Hypothetical protein SMAX5B_011827 [Scophthalmus maximus]|uniref:Uncharacterized protein n=1 Tax=Scophthalmus maximus TaxID=52904 RepID=A0A2U9AYI3_SCOMX|nr:Hypothetical protein SMAX5B_011827 [Scophthalmus maximus]
MQTCRLSLWSRELGSEPSPDTVSGPGPSHQPLRSGSGPSSPSSRSSPAVTEDKVSCSFIRPTTRKFRFLFFLLLLWRLHSWLPFSATVD